MSKATYKFTLIIFFNFLLSAFVFQVAGQTPESTASPSIVAPSVTETVSQKEIQDLKDKIATKVAELNKNKRAVAGVVADIGEDSLKILTDENVEYSAKIDPELTKIYAIQQSTKKEIKFTDIKKSTYVILSGTTLDNNVNANFIYQDTPFLVKSGKIIEINKDDHYFKVMTIDKDEYILDVENNTKQQMLNIKSLATERTGFSKAKEGDTIHFAVIKESSPKEKKRYSIYRYLIIPQEYF